MITIIIFSHHQVTLALWSSLTLFRHPCHPSLLAGLLSWILCPHRAYVSYLANTGTSMRRSSQGRVAYDFVLASLAVARKSYLNGS